MDIEAILQDSPVLDPDLHRPLMREVDAYAAQAGVHRHMIWTPLADMATQQEMDWVAGVKQMRQEGPYGLVYVGKGFQPTVEIRMMASAATCVRNFVDARVMPLHTVLERLRGPGIDCSVLLVPNFSLDAEEGGYVAKWLKGMLLDLLYERMTRQQITVLGVADMSGLASDFGEAFSDIVKSHYRPIKK